MKTLRDLLPITRPIMTEEVIGELHEAMEAVATGIAAELEPGEDPVMLSTCTTLSALRQPVSLAAAYTDLCSLLGIPVPRIVVDAVR